MTADFIFALLMLPASTLFALWGLIRGKNWMLVVAFIAGVWAFMDIMFLFPRLVALH